MSKLVILSVGEGDWENGFSAVALRLWQAGNPLPMQFRGGLPAAPEVPKLYRAWRLLYEALYHRLNWHPRIEIDTADVTNVSEFEFNDVCQRLSDTINTWLNSPPFRNIDQQLRAQIRPSEEVRFTIETNDHLLRRLPWHLWTFFEHYPQAEVALSALEYQSLSRSLPETASAKVKILAILGNGRGIDIKKDRAFLEQLSDKAETKFLVEPQPEHLNDQLWECGWDILFFAGHSSSQAKGVLQLNQKDSITLEQLQYALKKAISRGLKLAIFNSCDGLSLAQSLSELQIPQVIVMREPVADVVAQEFLRYFLVAFSNGQSLYASVREARERLQILEDEYPCATWLPVICQNPAEVPMSWPKWGTPEGAGPGQRNPHLPPGRGRAQAVLIASTIVTALVIGVRWLGMLQPLELQAYDQLMRSRPDEGQDQRLLIVTITENDFQLPQQKQRQGSLSDLALAQLLEKLETYQPRAIGLDIYRDNPIDRTQVDLAARLQSHNDFFAICKVQDREADDPGVAPPPDVPIERQGFSDVAKDPDGTLRRHLFAMNPEPTSPCTVPYALSAQLAFHYLGTEGIAARYTQKGDLQLGDVVFKRLQAHRGGYQQADTWGYQTLLNYRSYRSPINIAPTVTLTEVLKGSIKPDQVKDRIILIGVTAQSAHDYVPTPYQEMPGVIVQAQMVSQILSAVKDGRPLLGVWPWWGEVLWVWVWSAVGGILVCSYRPRRLKRVLAGGVSPVVLYILCFALFTQGSWVPLVPAALALVLTGSSVGVYFAFQAQRQQYPSITLRYD